MVAMPTILDVEEHHTTDQLPVVEGEQLHLVSDDEEELGQPTPEGDQLNEVQSIEFSASRECMDQDETLKQEFTSKEQEYMYWHTRLGHLSKTRMRQLAKRGGIPRYLSTVDPPLCVACIHGKQPKSHGEPSLSPAKLQRKLRTQDNVSQWLRWNPAQQAS